METIGLIAAMTQESEAVLRLIGGATRIGLGSFRGARFRLMDRDCLLVTSGMGPERAADGARALLAAASLQALLSFGIAGAVSEDLQIGDVVVARNTCLLDRGLPGALRPLASLSQAAWDAAAGALQPDGARLLAGTAITTRGSQLVLRTPEQMTSPVLEMETMGIAGVADEAGVPLVSIRSVSDGPQSPIPFDLEALLDEKYNFRVGKMMLAVLRRPQIILQSRQMMQNSRKAADHAARALVAALSQPLPFLSV